MKRDIERIMREYNSIFESVPYEEHEESDNSENIDGDGAVHVFDRGEDFPYVERYIAIMPDGMAFFIGHNGGVGTWGDSEYNYSTKGEMEDEFEGEEISVFPQAVKKGLNLIASNYYDVDGETEISEIIRSYIK